LEEAKKLFYEMFDRNINPDAVAYNVLINGLCKEGEMEEAKKAASSLDDVTNNILMGGLYSVGNFNKS